VSKRTRNRELARLARRRQAEKRRRQRNRQFGTIAVALIVAVVGGFLAFNAFTGDEPAATGATGPTGPSGSPTPSVEPGAQTGTVQPEPGPEQVACGGKTPKGALEPKPQFGAPADVTKKNRTYTATLQTSCGDIVIELLSDQAPETVNSFVFLAEQGFFDATRIHRIDTLIDVLQGGDPTGTGTGGPGYSIPDELNGQESYGPGVVAMANSGGADTGGSQFFIITGDKGHGLDSNAAYTIFGTVIEGMDVAKLIQGLDIEDPEAAAAGDLSGQQPKQAVYIEKVTISSKPAG
jgi:cyclophilin family peptidyl-prolyl cis-trans isomerase